ncbi:MAG: hypothetical protein MI794_16770 [Pseudomonadales bacterium]|nr:hypothetical protein [Pseudomonadales bacterium]
MEDHDLAYFQRMVDQYPNNQIYKLELQRAEFLKEQDVTRQAQSLINLGRFEAARLVVEAGLSDLPESFILRDLNKKLENLVSSDARLDLAVEAIESGNSNGAIELLQESLRLNPGNDEAMVLLKRVKLREIPQRSSETIALHFDKLELKSAIEFITRSFGISVIFDDGVKDVPISMDVDSLDFYQALDSVLQLSKHYFKVVDPQTIIVYPDSRDKRAQYEELVLRATQLEFINVKDMAAILKGVLNLNEVTLNESTNLLMIRDTSPMMALVDQLIAINDVPQPQVLLDVEILEINKSQSEQLGVDFGSYQIGLNSEPVPLGQSILGTFNETSTLTLPSVGLKALMQDVDAKILANPKIRVVNQREAKIHIGDRVPLRSSSILDATGQTRTTFEYQDIGIRLAVKPQIHPNNDTTLEVSLEVSALGENLGTTEEPAYRIGSRNAETIMVLSDGESVLLGGLIREEERRSFSSIPGIANNSVLREIFSYSDDSAGRTDVLLTITPRVIRANRLNEVLHDLEIQTGTLDRPFVPSNEQIYRLSVGEPLFQNAADLHSGRDMSVVLDGAETAEPAAEDASVSKDSPTDLERPRLELVPAAQPDIEENAVIVSVLPAQQNLGLGQQITLSLRVSELSATRLLESSVLFNPNLLTFKGAEPVTPYVSALKVDTESAPNSVGLVAEVNPELEPVSDVDVIELTFEAANKGTSFLVLKTPVITSTTSERRGAVSRNGRVSITN